MYIMYYKILATLGTNNFEPKRTYCTKSIDSIYFNGPKFCSKYTLIYLQRSYSCLCKEVLLHACKCKLNIWI